MNSSVGDEINKNMDSLPSKVKISYQVKKSQIRNKSRGRVNTEQFGKIVNQHWNERVKDFFNGNLDKLDTKC